MIWITTIMVILNSTQINFSFLADNKFWTSLMGIVGFIASVLTIIHHFVKKSKREKIAAPDVKPSLVLNYRKVDSGPESTHGLFLDLHNIGNAAALNIHLKSFIIDSTKITPMRIKLDRTAWFKSPIAIIEPGAKVSCYLCSLNPRQYPNDTKISIECDYLDGDGVSKTIKFTDQILSKKSQEGLYSSNPGTTVDKMIGTHLGLNRPNIKIDPRESKNPYIIERLTDLDLIDLPLEDLIKKWTEISND